MLLSISMWHPKELLLLAQPDRYSTFFGLQYVTVPGKNDHFVIIPISSYWYHVKVRYSLYATVISDSR